MKRIIIPVLILSVLFLSGCGESTSGTLGKESKAAVEQEGGNAEDSDPNPAEVDLKTSVNLELRPNEAGKIMILMYHNIGSEEEEWVRTPANFLKDMNTLYEKGYRPISLKDYLTGNITTEPGYTPVVITFDDGNLNNFEYLENGKIKEDCAVGLLLGFHEIHKDFPLEATFFVYGEHPFRQDSLISDKLNFILQAGMDIGNHTRDHNSFKKAGPEEIQEQIGSEAQYLENILSEEQYVIDTLALPFGERPKEEDLEKSLQSGSYQGIPYKNAAVLNVGWNPAFSPYDKRFDPFDLPRIRASEMKVDHVGLYNYIQYFDKHPEERFVSDGIPQIITVPSDRNEFVKMGSDKEVYFYSPQ